MKQWTDATESSRLVNRQWLLMQASLDRYDADPPGRYVADFVQAVDAAGAVPMGGIPHS